MNGYWRIPSKGDAEFAACMEGVPDVYELPYNPACLMVCVDEKPYQLLGDEREPLPMRFDDDQKTDPEYKRNGVCSIFAFIEPLGGRHHVGIHEHRTAIGWAQEIHYTPKHGKQSAIVVKLKYDGISKQVMPEKS